MVLLACSSQVGKTFDECRLLYPNAVVVGVVNSSNYGDELAVSHADCVVDCTQYSKDAYVLSTLYAVIGFQS